MYSLIIQGLFHGPMTSLGVQCSSSMPSNMWGATSILWGFHAFMEIQSALVPPRVMPPSKILQRQTRYALQGSTSHMNHAK
jgi:hypothetical protein